MLRRDMVQRIGAVLAPSHATLRRFLADETEAYDTTTHAIEKYILAVDATERLRDTETMPLPLETANTERRASHGRRRGDRRERVAS